MSDLIFCTGKVVKINKNIDRYGSCFYFESPNSMTRVTLSLHNHMMKLLESEQFHFRFSLWACSECCGQGFPVFRCPGPPVMAGVSLIVLLLAALHLSGKYLTSKVKWPHIGASCVKTVCPNRHLLTNSKKCMSFFRFSSIYVY